MQGNLHANKISQRETIGRQKPNRVAQAYCELGLKDEIAKAAKKIGGPARVIGF
jgi:hypothetical protein